MSEGFGSVEAWGLPVLLIVDTEKEVWHLGPSGLVNP